jgi:hypothetical protein
LGGEEVASVVLVAEAVGWLTRRRKLRQQQWDGEGEENAEGTGAESREERAGEVSASLSESPKERDELDVVDLT